MEIISRDYVSYDLSTQLLQSEKLAIWAGTVIARVVQLTGVNPQKCKCLYFRSKGKSCRNRHIQKLNSNLKFLTEKLKLTIPLKLKMARDSYATTLKRANVPTSQIGEMMGHSNSVVTEHYLATLDIEKTWEINESLY